MKTDAIHGKNHRLKPLMLAAAVAMSASFSFSACVTPPTGQVAWYRAEGNATDAAGLNHGTVQTGTTFGPAEVGQGFLFDGINSSVSIPASASLDVGSGGGSTIEGWINPTDVQTAQPLVEWFQGSGPPWGVHFWISEAGSGTGPGCLYVNIPDTFGGEHKYSSAAGLVGTNAWQHVAVTYDQVTGISRLLYNGTAVATQNLGSFTPQTSYPLYLGRRPPGRFIGVRYHGAMDEVGIYNRALATNEIYAIYAAGSAGKCVVSNPPPPSSSVPRVTSFNPAAATVGNVVTILGTNFSPVAASNLVYFGAVRANVLTVSPTSLTVTVPSGATYGPITVAVNGRMGFANTDFLPTFFGNGQSVSAATFAPRQDVPVAYGNYLTVIADFDGDGKPDLGVSDGNAHTLSLFRNLGSAGALSASSFAPPLVLTITGSADAPYGFTAADMDGDGKIDLVFTDPANTRVGICQNISVPGTLTTNSFASPVYFTTGHGSIRVRVRDLDGDGRPDLVVCNNGDSTLSVLRNLGTPGGLNTNSFAPAFSLFSNPNPFDFVIQDLDGDGKPDLAVANDNSSVVSLFRNVSTPGALTTSSFAPRIELPTYSGQLTITAGDVDGDGKPELLVGGRANTLSIFRNLANPGSLTLSSFAAPVDFVNPGWVHNVAFGDINGDGKPDLVVVGELNSYLAVYQNQSTPGTLTTASLAPRVDFGTGWNAWGVSVGDLDGDGRPDVFFCNDYETFASLYRNLTPTTNPPPVVPPVITAQPTNVTVYVGSNVTFRVTATGDAPLSYQWWHSIAPLAGKTASTLSLTSVQGSDGGSYFVVVTNAAGSVTSSPAILTVNPLPPCANVFSNLVSWWRAENDTTDNWGENNLATGAKFVAGKVGLAFNSPLLSAADSPSLRFSNALTIEAWGDAE